MLKIKDNVDLKELEKFGFENVGNMYVSREYVYRPYLMSNMYRIIIMKDRKMQINCPTKNIYDKLFDIIQAGLVEKVEDK